MLSKYITVSLIACIVAMWLCIETLTTKINSLNADLVVSKTNELSLIKSIESQNEQISKYEIDLKTKTDNYIKLLGKEPEIRYETVYKRVPSIKVKSNECDDIKKLIDDIRAAGY